MLNLWGKKCLIVGAGKIAAEKIAGLLAHGAEITVVSPRAGSSIQKQARTGVLQWKKRHFLPGDVRSSFLVIAATNSNAVNSEVFRACRRFHVLCNAVDDPENCDFFCPAVVRRGPLEIAISTNGRSPALASRLRRQLEKQFGAEWGRWVEELGETRQQLLAQTLSGPVRRLRLLKMASPASFRAYTRKRTAGKRSSSSKKRG